VNNEVSWVLSLNSEAATAEKFMLLQKSDDVADPKPLGDKVTRADLAKVKQMIVRGKFKEAGYNDYNVVGCAKFSNVDFVAPEEPPKAPKKKPCGCC